MAVRPDLSRLGNMMLLQRFPRSQLCLGTNHDLCRASDENPWALSANVRASSFAAATPPESSRPTRHRLSRGRPLLATNVQRSCAPKATPKMAKTSRVGCFWNLPRDSLDRR
jgi:hypothetical protein